MAVIQPTPILLIGAQKSGSSFLFRLIAQDPTIGQAKLKEPKILSKPKHDRSDFFSHFNIATTHRFVLDGSTSYLHVAGTAERAASQLGTAIPVLVVLRDPAVRAISGYLHEVKHGRELRMPEEVFDLPSSLEAATDAENRKIGVAWRRGLVQPHCSPTERYRDPMFGFRYITNSRYKNQLEHWLSLFSNLRFVDFSTLCADPLGVLTRVRAWLGLATEDVVCTDQAKNPTVLRPWAALRANRALLHDNIRPSLLNVWCKQRALFRSLSAEKPRLPVGLVAALNVEFDCLKQQEARRWL